MKPMLDARLWHKRQECWSAGYLFAPDGKYYEGKQIADYFRPAMDETALKALIKHANGCFGYLCELSGVSYAVVDVVRSVPLYYESSAAAITIGDNTDNIHTLNAAKVNTTPPEILAEYLLTGYVTGCDTLIPSVKQIPAGHYLKWIKGKEPELIQYYRFTHAEPQDAKQQDYLSQLDCIHLALAERLAESLQGRTAVVPLSGGHDSRLVAWLLKRVNYPKVMCFSYGAQSNQESRISRAVAKELGFAWRFVPHSRSSWYKAFQSEQRREFFKYAGSAASSPNIQDWLAVKVMHDKHILPQDAVFIPGHTGDFIEGLHLPDAYQTQQEFSAKELAAQIIAAHYDLWKWNKAEHYDTIATRITTQLSIPDRMDAPTAASLFEEWEWAERQAKAIVNSLRVYDYFGYAWRIPLWDRELMDFWSKVPLSLRCNRRLWNQYERQYIKIPVPYLGKPPMYERIPVKLVRCTIGELMDVRYGRFSKPANLRQYTNARVESLLNPAIKYPAFIKPQQRLLRSSINGLQALISVLELQHG